ncbi:MAG: tRNA pseudouridine(38-40) synthase TruA [Nitrospirae bacterium]|nr:tRNA pseudouridine(38-40) synthase TruA [Nitrospirota bacterium]
MPNIKLVIEYDGSRYHGWQRQPNLPTLQGTIEDAAAKIAGEPITVIGAGRTDAGVHAEGQAAHFKTRARLQPREWQSALNSLLPEDIVIRDVRNVPDRFHARYSAIGKIYRYRILNRRHAPAIGRQYIWTVYPALNIRRMRSAARALLGRRDFRSFQGTDKSADRKEKKGRTAICTIRRLVLTREEQTLCITIEADRFLQQMVRTIVGTLVEVGRGRRDPGEMKTLIQKKDRRFSGPTAPPRGLCLVKVLY